MPGSVPAVQRATVPATFDREADARAWLGALRASGAERDDALRRLHELLLGAARFELGRRRGMLAGSSREAVDDLATQSADDALVAILSKLDDYRFESRFTTWAYKFAILEAAVRTRRRAWQERELPIDPDAWTMLPARTLDPAAGTRTSSRRCSAPRAPSSPARNVLTCSTSMSTVSLPASTLTRECAGCVSTWPAARRAPRSTTACEIC